MLHCPNPFPPYDWKQKPRVYKIRNGIKMMVENPGESLPSFLITEYDLLLQWAPSLYFYPVHRSILVFL